MRTFWLTVSICYWLRKLHVKTIIYCEGLSCRTLASLRHSTSPHRGLGWVVKPCARGTLGAMCVYNQNTITCVELLAALEELYPRALNKACLIMKGMGWRGQVRCVRFWTKFVREKNEIWEGKKGIASTFLLNRLHGSHALVETNLGGSILEHKCSHECTWSLLTT